jgi:hypothetical protein
MNIYKFFVIKIKSQLNCFSYLDSSDVGVHLRAVLTFHCGNIVDA